VAQEVFHHTFPNGLTLLAERMEHVRSAAMNFLVPAGCAHDPPENLGVASVLSDLITRGAGPRDSRQLTEALDNLGLDRDESVGVLHMRFWGATLARNLPAALELYADILRRPHLPDDELEAVQALALQDLQSLEDEPRQKAMIELRRRLYPAPLGNDRRGTRAGVESLTPDTVRGFYHRHFHGRGTLLSVAGNIDWPSLRDQVGRLFGDWEPGEDPPLRYGEQRSPRAHIVKETQGTQITLAYPSVPIGDPDYYVALGAVNVLSGSSSARLFTEVREKRGLCYAVSASYQTFKDRASVICYADPPADKAQETLDVMSAELKRLGDGIDADEVERVRVGLKTSLIMQAESTSARAGSLASDWYYLGRVRGPEEIRAAIEALTPDNILDHVRRYPPERFTIVTLGPKPVRLPHDPWIASANIS
jgi:predicted Zn-dependent peptidase